MPWHLDLPRRKRDKRSPTRRRRKTFSMRWDKLLRDSLRTLRKWPAVGNPIICRTIGRVRHLVQPRTAAEASADRAHGPRLRRLGYCHTGANARPAAARCSMGISSAHFDPYAASRDALKRAPPCNRLVRNSTLEGKLNRRLFDTGIKDRHLRALRSGRDLARRDDFHDPRPCQRGSRRQPPRESAELSVRTALRRWHTHCGRKKPQSLEPERFCLRCGNAFTPRDHRQRYCSRACGIRWDRRGKSSIQAREGSIRPPRDQLLRQEIEELGYLAVGRSYGVSDNAIRKWIRAYERERAVAEGRDPDLVEIPRRTWPNRRRHKAA